MTQTAFTTTDEMTPLECFDWLVAVYVDRGFPAKPESPAGLRVAKVRSALGLEAWLSIDDAPVGISGHVWDPKNPSRTDLMGTVHEFDPGNGIKERYVVGSGNTGMKFTHWHPFPEPAKPLPSLQDKDR